MSVEENTLEKDYSKLLIKDYPLWSLYLYENQGYLGRCYVWCKRKDALDFPDATEEEVLALRNILKEVEIALNMAFNNPGIINYAILGNVTHHLHCHVIPRYEKPVKFAGKIFKDKRWGKNYQTNNRFVTPPEVMQKILDEIKYYIT